MQCISFPPIIGKMPKILILGSMPGRKSLDETQYYAHPQNLFWPIIEHTFGCPFTNSYGSRIECLLKNNIALWDVIGSCHREGSLDSAITNAQPNPIFQLVKDNPTIHTIALNGKTAAKVFHKEFPNWDCTKIHVLPSTSPANASIPRNEKIKQWQKALNLAV